MEIGEVIGHNEEVVVGHDVESSAGEGFERLVHAAAEEAHGVLGEVGLQGEVEGLDGDVGVGE